MTEFYTSKHIDNSRLLRPVAPRHLREFAKRLTCGAVLAAFCLLYAWQHFEYIQQQYRLEDLQARHTQAVELNQQLHLEAASLTSPRRIDAIARQQLGMTVTVPARNAPADLPQSPYLAQQRAPVPPVQP